MIWVAGGSLANLLAVWLAHGLAPVLEECWHRRRRAHRRLGRVGLLVHRRDHRLLRPAAPGNAGLGFLPFSNSAHHDAQGSGARRSPSSSPGTLAQCYATDNGAAVTFFGTVFHEAVSDTAGARAWHLTRNDDGTVREEPLPTRLLPDWDPSA